MLRDRRAAGGVVLLAGLVVGATVLARSVASPPGLVLRTVPLAGTPWSNAAVDTRQGHVFVGLLDTSHDRAYLSVLDTHTGAMVRTRSLGLHPGTIMVNEHTNRLVLLHSGYFNGPNIITSFDLSRVVALRDMIVTGEPACAALDAQTDQVFLACTQDGRVRMLDGTTGRVVRALQLGQYHAEIVVDEPVSRVLVAQLDGHVGLLDARHGALLHTTWVGGQPIHIALDHRSNRAFVFGESEVGHVSVLDATSGALLTTVAVGHAPTAVAVDETTGRVFVTNFRSDSVSVLDATTGRVVRTIAVGPHPLLAAVSARTGCAFVITQGLRGLPSTAALIGPASAYALDARTGTVLAHATIGMDPRAVLADPETGHVFVFLAGGTATLPGVDPWGWAPGWLRAALPLPAPPAPHLATFPPSVVMLGAPG